MYWNVWHRKLRVKVYHLLPENFWVSPLGFWLYYHKFVLDGDADDAWCGSFELGPED